MHLPKRYGQSKIDRCPFCSKQAFSKNKEGVAVCADHKEAQLPEMRCACGEMLTLMHGKFGTFYTCIQCGAMSMKKVLEINEVKDVAVKPERTQEKNDVARKNPREIETTSDDPMYFD